MVLDWRPLSNRFPAGLFVAFPPDELARFRSTLGLGSSPEARAKGRRETRVECDFPVRFVDPSGGRGAVRSISASGMAGTCALAMERGTPVQVVLTLPDGKDRQVAGKVAWCRPELGLVGVQFESPSADLVADIQALVSRLLEDKAVVSTNAARPDVIIAEDEVPTANMLATSISKLGFTVVKAFRGDEALAEIRSKRPRLALLDVLMPGFDGPEVCKAIRADAMLSRMPVILLSAMGEDRLKAVALEAGASDYLNKPVSLRVLSATVASFLTPLYRPKEGKDKK
jgi:CheY-like chemotaxis protein